MRTRRRSEVWRPRASFKCIVDKNGTQYSLIPLMEPKEAFDYTIPSFSVIIYRGRSEFVSRFFSKMVYSAAVTEFYPRRRGGKCTDISYQNCYRAKL